MSWTCLQCTLINIKTSEDCECCGNRKEPYPITRGKKSELLKTASSLKRSTSSVSTAHKKHRVVKSITHMELKTATTQAAPAVFTGDTLAQVEEKGQTLRNTKSQKKSSQAELYDRLNAQMHIINKQDYDIEGLKKRLIKAEADLLRTKEALNEALSTSSERESSNKIVVNVYEEGGEFTPVSFRVKDSSKVSKVVVAYSQEKGLDKKDIEFYLRDNLTSSFTPITSKVPLHWDSPRLVADIACGRDSIDMIACNSSRSPIL